MKKRRNPKTTFFILIVALSLALLAMMLYFLKSDFLFSWVTAWSVVTLGMNCYDKAQSKIGGGRVPEITLHLGAMLGGVAGAWAGRLFCHHKTRKSTFLIVLILSALVWLILGYWYYFLFP